MCNEDYDNATDDYEYDDEEESEVFGQAGLIGAICEYVGRTYEGSRYLNIRQMNAIIKAATDVVDEIESPHIPVEDGMGLMRWWKCDETGLSSLYMASRIMERIAPGSVSSRSDFYYPRDAHDFGRCVGLLRACPEMRLLIGVMLEEGPEWKAIAENWDELEEMWNKSKVEGELRDVGDLNERMAELIGNA